MSGFPFVILCSDSLVVKALDCLTKRFQKSHETTKFQTEYLVGCHLSVFRTPFSNVKAIAMERRLNESHSRATSMNDFWTTAAPRRLK